MAIRSKSGKRNKLNSDMLLVTIDISKDKHTGYFRCPNGRESDIFEFENKRDGFKFLYKESCSFAKFHGLTGFIVGYESTGSYGKPLSHFLSNKGVKLVQVNPMHTKRLKELDGNSPNKTDFKDPRVIADIINLGHFLQVINPEGAAAELRSLSIARERQTKDLTAHTNLLQDLIGVIFPEFFHVFKSIDGVTALHLLTNYPDPKSIVKLGMNKLVEIMEKKSRKRFGFAKAKELYQAAKETIGVCQGKESILFEIKHKVETIQLEKKFISSLEDKMERYLDEISYSANILSIKGIGVVTTAGIIGEVGDFSKFRVLPELIKLAGLDLYEVSSGKHTGERRISKRGRPLLRKLLYFAALRTIKTGGIYYDKYQQYLASGKKKMKAVIAISKKLLGVIFALVRKNTCFDTNHIKEEEPLALAA